MPDVLKNIRLERMISNNIRSGKDFKGKLNFVYSQSNTDVVDINSTVVNVSVEITQKDATGTTVALVDNIGISNCPLGVFFNNCEYKMNNTPIAQCDDFHEIQYRDSIIGKTPQYLLNNQSNNPCILWKHGNDQYANQTERLTGHAKEMKASVGFSAGASASIVTFSDKLHFLKMSKEDSQIYGNVNHQIDLLINNNYLQSLFTNNTTDIPIFVEGNTIPANTAHILVNVVNVDIYMLVYEVLTIPRSMTSKHFYTTYFTESHNIINRHERWNISLPQGVVDILAYFAPQNGSTGTINSPVNFHETTNANDAQLLLQSYDIRFNDVMYAANTYNLNLAITDSDRIDVARAYENFKYETYHLTEVHTNIFDYGVFLNNFVIYHRLEKTNKSSMNNVCYLNFKFKQTPANARIVLVCRVKNELGVIYDSNGMIEDNIMVTEIK